MQRTRQQSLPGGLSSLSALEVKCLFTPLPNILNHPPPQRIFLAFAVSIYGKGVTLTDYGLELAKAKITRLVKEPPF